MNNIKAVKPVEKLLTKGEKLINQVLLDFTPDSTGKVKGISIRTTAKAIKFIVKHPMISFKALRFANSSKISEKEKLQAILSSETVWNFIKTHSDSLPAVGSLLAKQNVPEFMQGGILDSEALGILKNTLNNDQNLKCIQNILLDISEPEKSWDNAIRNFLSLLKDDKLLDYFNVKKESIVAYIKNTEISSIYDVDPKLLGQLPHILTKIPQIENIYNQYRNSEQGVIPAILSGLDLINHDQVLSNFFKENPDIISRIAKATLAQNAELGASAIEYKFDSKLFDITTILLEDPELSQQLTPLMQKQDWQNLALTFTRNLNKLQLCDYVTDNKIEITDFIEAIYQKTPEMQSAFPKHVPIKEVVHAYIDNPDQMQQIAENYQNGGILGGVKALGNAAQTFGIGTLYQIAKNYIFNNDQNTALSTTQDNTIYHNLTESEHYIIDNIAKQIGTNLFQDGIYKNRKEDLSLIRDHLKTSFNELKETAEYKNSKLDKLLNKNRTDSLTHLFYSATNYTVLGMMLTGGIYLDKTKLNSEFKTQLTQELKNAVLPPSTRPLRASLTSTSNQSSHAAIVNRRHSSSSRSR